MFRRRVTNGLLELARARPQNRAMGSFLSDVWHARQNMVMKRQHLMSRISLVLGHGGYVLGLLEYGVTDIVWLRLFAIGGCGMVVGYQLLQPRVQWISATWCFVYVAVNVYQLFRFIGSSPPALSWEEARLHGLFSHRITASQFSSLMALGEWLWLVDGALLAEQGRGRGAPSEVFFVAEGTCEASVGGRRLAWLGPGSLVGEAAVLRDGDTRRQEMTVTAQGSVRCFAVPAAQLQALLDTAPELRAPLERIFSDALAAKFAAMIRQIEAHKYQAALEVACTLDDRAGIASGISKIRGQYGISLEDHVRLMEELPQCAHKPFRGAPPGARSRMET